MPVIAPPRLSLDAAAAIGASLANDSSDARDSIPPGSPGAPAWTRRAHNERFHCMFAFEDADADADADDTTAKAVASDGMAKAFVAANRVSPFQQGRITSEAEKTGDIDLLKFASRCEPLLVSMTTFRALYEHAPDVARYVLQSNQRLMNGLSNELFNELMIDPIINRNDRHASRDIIEVLGHFSKACVLRTARYVDLPDVWRYAFERGAISEIPASARAAADRANRPRGWRDACVIS
jgi:hypothetical protein